MKTHRFLFIIAIALVFGIFTARVANAQTLYSLDMTSDKTGDFRLAQIGNTFGQPGVQTNQLFSYNGTTDTYTLEGRYNQDRTAVLTVPLDTPPGSDPQGYRVGNVALSLDFTYKTNATNSDIILSLRQSVGNISAGPGINTYPNYFVRLLDNATFELREFTGFNTTTLLDSGTLTGLVGGSNYRLTFRSRPERT